MVSGRRGRRWGFLVVLVMPLSSNFAQSPQVPAEAMTAEQIFKLPSKEKKFTPAEALAQFEGAADDVYRLGEGDQLTVETWDHPELSGKQAVGPDGSITLPLVGTLRVSGLSREETAGAIKETLSRDESKAAEGGAHSGTSDEERIFG